MNNRTTWTGKPPASGAQAARSHWREVDAGGSAWYVAQDARGLEMFRVLVEPGPALKASLEKGAKDRAKEQAAALKRAKRIEALKAKRSKKKALTAKERDELMDHLLGL